MGTPTPSRAGIYTRLSKDKPEERSREDQEADCRALCRAKGLDVVVVHTDLESGYRRTARRPGYDALLADLEAGTIDAVVIWKLDRLTRQGIRQIAPLLEVLERSKAVLVSVNDSIDTSTAMGEGVLGLLASMAKGESETMSLRIRRSKLHHAENGRHRDGGRRAFGLTRDWSEVVPEEAAMVTEAADRVLAGESLRSICLDWNARGLPSASGTTWKTPCLRSLLLSPRLYGYRNFGGYRGEGQLIGPGNWPIVLAADKARRVEAVLSDPRRRSSGGARSYLLTGFVRCGRCGGPMRSTQPAGGKRKYHCPAPPDGCAGIAILADATEAEVAERLVHRERVIVIEDSPDTDVMLGAIDVDQAQLEELAQDRADHLMSRAEWLVARDVVAARLAARRAELADAAVVLPSTAEGVDWESLSFDQRRVLLTKVVDRIVIQPATGSRNRWNPDRIKVEWRS